MPVKAISPLYPQRRQGAVAEDEQVIQRRVDAQRGDAGNERENGSLHAAKQRLRHGGQCRREERPGVGLQIGLPQRTGGVVLGVQP